MAQIGETELDVRALARALWRRSWLLVLLAIVVAVGTYVGLGFVDPLYTADLRILIEERESPLTRPREDAGPPSSDFDESAIQSQVEVLRSREIAEAVIDKLDLTTRPEFDPARRPSLLRSVLVMLGVGENPTDSSVRQRVMDAYFERLSVFPLQKSRVVGVEFSAPNPVLAAEVANAVADAFVELQTDAKRQSAVAATSWLNRRSSACARGLPRRSRRWPTTASGKGSSTSIEVAPAKAALTPAISLPSSSAKSMPSWRALVLLAPKPRRGRSS